MSAARSKTSVWYKDHYEKIAVTVVLVALLGSAIFLLIRSRQEQQALTEARWDRIHVQHDQFTPVDVDAFLPTARLLEEPIVIGVHTTGLMVSERRVMSVNPDVRTPIPYDAETCPWTGFPQPSRGDRDTTGDGIPDEWLAGFGLDPFDPTIGDRDVDGDGFTVREEFEAGTNPTDPADHPSYAYKLRLLRFREIPFGLRFQGVHEISAGDMRFQLNVVGRDRSFFVRMGEDVQGYTLVDFERRTRPGRLGPEDGSILTLERADGRQIRLEIDRDLRVDERLAELLFTVDNSTHRIREGDTLKLMGQTFKVIDIQRDEVVIRDMKRDEEIPVGRSTAAAPRAREATESESDEAMSADMEAFMEAFESQE